MTRQELKVKLISIRNGAFITPILEEIWEIIQDNMTQQQFDEWYIKMIELRKEYLNKLNNDNERNKGKKIKKRVPRKNRT